MLSADLPVPYLLTSLSPGPLPWALSPSSNAGSAPRRMELRLGRLHRAELSEFPLCRQIPSTAPPASTDFLTTSPANRFLTVLRLCFPFISMSLEHLSQKVMRVTGFYRRAKSLPPTTHLHVPISYWVHPSKRAPTPHRLARTQGRRAGVGGRDATHDD
jgi:hypothetical protein